MQAQAAFPRLSGSLTGALGSAAGPLLFGLRMWISVCLALYVAFWLELDNPYWAGASAAIVCQPQLGASLRKGWFRIIGTLIGATMIVVLTALFPQDRIAFLGLLALWGGACAFVATLLHNFASYGAALAGYTAAIIAADTLGATGGASADVFLLAVWRATEICIGIVCAGIVLAGTDLGGARQKLAVTFATLASDVMGAFLRMLERSGPQLETTQAERREFVRRVVALDPVIDQTLGESSDVRYRASTLETAVHGLLRALDGWRGIAAHLGRTPDQTQRSEAELILRNLPPELRLAPEAGSSARWLADPLTLRRVCKNAIQTFLALPTRSPSLRLLADQTARSLTGMLHVLDALALLVNVGRQPASGPGGIWPNVPDWLPALINATRAFLVIAAVEIFWLASGWSSGTLAIVFVAVVLLILSPRGDVAFAGAVAAGLGIAVSVICAAIVEFGVLPALQSFPAFCAALGLFFIPAGFAIASSKHPAITVALSTMTFIFIPLMAPTNPMTYDTSQFYNAALAVFVGCVIAPLAFRLLPPLPPAVRAKRLLALSLRDLHRLAISRRPPRAEVWERRLFARLVALPDQAEPLQRGQLLAALSIGTAILDLRRMASNLGIQGELGTILEAFAKGNSAIARGRLAELDRNLASRRDGDTDTVRARSQILLIDEALSRHSPYFEAGAPA